jgi:hypothetical protein
VICSDNKMISFESCVSNFFRQVVDVRVESAKDTGKEIDFMEGGRARTGILAVLNLSSREAEPWAERNVGQMPSLRTNATSPLMILFAFSGASSIEGDACVWGRVGRRKQGGITISFRIQSIGLLLQGQNTGQLA